MRAMREINTASVSDLVSRLYQEANFSLPPDVLASFRSALLLEESERGRMVLETLLENADVAARRRVPLCQDTGLAAVFIRIGQDVHLNGKPLAEAVNEGVARAQREGYLRASVVSSPCLKRENTGDNTPAVLHAEIVAGEVFDIAVLPKGAGSENMSRLQMLSPADGLTGLVDFVIETVDLAGARPCPPLFLGVGVGGTMDEAARLSKQALLRPAGEANAEPELAALEQEILARVNALGIGPAGLGGTVTCLGVALEEVPCHIASLPVAVNVQCNCARRASGSL